MENFAGKTAVITGAASGIGFALAKLFAQKGMNVVMADIETQRLEGAAKELSAEKVKTEIGKIVTVQTDVSKQESVANLAKTAQQHFGEIHIVCNNAGVINAGSLWESSIEDYNWVMGVNLWGVIHGIREFVPILSAQSCESHIVNTVSMGALVSLPFSGIYYMTKAAVLSLSETLYHELSMTAPQVGVTALCPEFVHTNIAGAERNKPHQTSTSAHVVDDIKTMILQQLNDFTNSAEAATPDRLAERALQAIRQKRFYALAENNNPWISCMKARFQAISDQSNPPFLVPSRDGVADLEK